MILCENIFPDVNKVLQVIFSFLNEVRKTAFRSYTGYIEFFSHFAYLESSYILHQQFPNKINGVDIST